MAVNLSVVNRNPQPSRDRHYPEWWLVFWHGEEFQIHVAHDSDYRPHVLYKSAA